jgi:hypothetical protein
LARLPGNWEYATKVKWIDGRLESGLIGAAAGARRLKQQQVADLRIVKLKPSTWRGWACLADHDFWETGDITFYEFDVTGYGGRTVAHFHDVRFDPGGFHGINPPETGPVQSPAQATEKPTVSKAELAKWHEVFKIVHPDAAEALALQSAVAMFPEKHVPRQYVRDLRGPQKRGKPSSRHK